MAEANIRQRCHARVVAWSDGAGSELAERIATHHQDLLPRMVTHSQLMGLRAAVEVATDLSRITQYARHQGEKAWRDALKAYWIDLRRVLDQIEEMAVDVYADAQAGTPATPEDEAPSWLVLWMAREFTQHLICHSLYLGAKGPQRS